STTPKASVASGSTATRGSVRRRAKARGSAEAACEDTAPEPPPARAEGARRKQADEHDERRGDVVAGSRERAEADGAGLDRWAGAPAWGPLRGWARASSGRGVARGGGRRPPRAAREGPREGEPEPPPLEPPPPEPPPAPVVPPPPPLPPCCFLGVLSAAKRAC